MCSAREALAALSIAKEGKKMRCRVVAGLIIGLGAGPALAEDLMTIYRDALQQDPLYASAKSTYTATKEKLPQGRALFLPNVNATANANYNNFSANYRQATGVPVPGGNIPGSASYGSYAA